MSVSYALTEGRKYDFQSRLINKVFVLGHMERVQHCILKDMKKSSKRATTIEREPKSVRESQFYQINYDRRIASR